MSTRVAVSIWSLALVIAAGGAALVLASDHDESKAATIALAVPIGLAFVASGLIAWSRRPDNRTGLLMTLTGFTWFIGALSESNSSFVFTLGSAFGSVAVGFLLHLLLAFPTGRLESRARRIVAGGAYLVVFLGQPLTTLFDPLANTDCEGCPENAFLIEPNDGLAQAIEIVVAASGLVLVVAAVLILARRWRAATPALRRALAPVFLTGGAFFLLLVISLPVQAASGIADGVFGWLFLSVLLTIPVSFLLGLLRGRLARTGAGRLLVDVPEEASLDQAQDGLRRALRDPTLQLAYWLPETGSYVDAEGRPFELRPDGSGRATTRIDYEDRPVAAIVHDAALLDEPQLLREVVAAARLGLEKDRLQAELRSRLDELERERDFIATVVNSAPSFFCVVDPDGKIVRFNKTLEGATRIVDDEQVRGRPFWEVFAVPEEAEEVRRGLQAAAVGLSRSEHENHWATLGGERLVVAWSSTPILDEFGQQRYLITGLDVTHRKRQEEELQASEERLRAVIESSPLAIIEADLEDKVTLWNPAAERIYGHSREEVMGRSVPVIPPEKLAEAEELWSRARSGEIIEGFETVRLRKDGNRIDVEIAAAPVRDARGELVGHLGLAAEITERKSREEVLRRLYAELSSSEERLRAVIEASPVAILEVDLEDRVRLWNPAAERMFGFSGDEARGFVVPILPPERRAELDGLIERTLSGEMYTGFESVRRRKDGSLFDVEISAAPVRDSAGRVVSHLALFSDITERKRQEQELRQLYAELSESEARFRELANSAPVMIWTADAEGRITFFNQRWLEFVGRSPEEELRHGWQENVHPDDAEEAIDRYLETVRVRGVYETEYRLRRADGTYGWVFDRGTPRILPDGTLAGYIGITVEITERKLAEEALRASRVRIVEAGDAERRRLERNLHDGAQQRLVTLSLALRLAQARLPSDPEGAGAMLEGASKELALGLEELRELARGIHPAVLTDRGLAPALEALADRASLPVELAELPGERLPEQVEAATYYLVSEALANVAKYAQASSVTVRVAQQDGRVVVQIDDDGIGGADPSRGSGIRGLIDRVEALSGHLEVESPPGAGTRLRAEIPCR